jgi:hypothetical protein
MMGLVKDFLFDLLKDILSEKILSTITTSVVLTTIWAAIKENYLVALLVISIAVALYYFRRASQVSAAGICKVYKSNGPSAAKALEKCKSSFYYLGVSAKNTADDINIAEKLVALSKNSSYEIRFLIMNPDERANIEKRAYEEGTTADAWIHDMNSAIKRIQDIATQNRITINIRLYDDYPLWRMFIIDKKIIYLNYALPSKKLNASPVLQIKGQSDSIYNSFFTHYEELWKKSKIIQ